MMERGACANASMLPPLPMHHVQVDSLSTTAGAVGAATCAQSLVALRADSAAIAPLADGAHAGALLDWAHQHSLIIPAHLMPASFSHTLSDQDGSTGVLVPAVMLRSSHTTRTVEFRPHAAEDESENHSAAFVSLPMRDEFASVVSAAGGDNAPFLSRDFDAPQFPLLSVAESIDSILNSQFADAPTTASHQSESLRRVWSSLAPVDRRPRGGLIAVAVQSRSEHNSTGHAAAATSLAAVHVSHVAGVGAELPSALSDDESDAVSRRLAHEISSSRNTAISVRTGPYRRAYVTTNARRVLADFSADGFHSAPLDVFVPPKTLCDLDEVSARDQQVRIARGAFQRTESSNVAVNYDYGAPFVSRSRRRDGMSDRACMTLFAASWNISEASLQSVSLCLVFPSSDNSRKTQGRRAPRLCSGATRRK